MAEKNVNNMIAVLGGNFDPIHQGHVLTTAQAATALNIHDVRVMPLGLAVHRDQPQASAKQRIEMCRLAIDDYAYMSVDEREVHRGDASFTYITLEQMRQEQGPEQAIAWIIGRDSLNTFTTWDEWRRILKAGHLLVLNRPGYENQAPVPQELEAYIKTDFEGAAGSIVMQRVEPMDISSTRVRQCLVNEPDLNRQDAHFLQSALHENVRQYIHQHQLYRKANSPL